MQETFSNSKCIIISLLSTQYQHVSLRAPFRSALLVTFDLSEFCYFYSHVILKLSEHSRSVAKLEKDF